MQSEGKQKINSRVNNGLVRLVMEPEMKLYKIRKLSLSFPLLLHSKKCKST